MSEKSLDPTWWNAAPEELSGDYDDYDEPYEEDEFESFYCHMRINPKTKQPTGCGKAGSEECDFECPYRRLYGYEG